MDDPFVRFTCNVDEDATVSFTIIHFVIREHYQCSITIEGYSSEINVWIANNVIHDLLYSSHPRSDENYLSSRCGIDGAFCWIDNFGQEMFVYRNQ